MSNMYIVINGDDSGAELSENILNDNIQAFSDASGKLNNARGSVDKIIQDAGGKIIASNADEAVYELPNQDYNPITASAMKAFEEQSGKTLTIGIGNSLSEAYKALIQGKENGKNQVNKFSNENKDDPQSEDEQNEDEVVDEDQDGIPDNEEVIEEGQEPQDESQNENQDEYDSEENDQNEEVDPNQDELVEDDSDHKNVEQSPKGHKKDNKDIPFLSDEDLDQEQMPEFVEDDEEGDDMSTEGEQNQEDSDEMPEEVVDQQSDENPEEIGYEEDTPDENEMAIPQQEIQDDNNFEEEQMPEEQNDNSELREKIMSSLLMFKENKGAIEQAKETDPEAYQSMINMLQAMIEMAKQLGISTSVQNEESDVIPQDKGQTIPKM